MKFMIFIVKSFIRLLHIFPIDNNKIFINNFYGNGYNENPKYLAEELLKKKKYKLYWVVKDMNTKLPKEIKKVKINSIPYFYTIATAKLWISNVRLPAYFTKRKKQYYIQTAHGSLFFKKIEFDVLDKLDNYYKMKMYNDNKMMDLFISNSIYFDKLIRSAYGFQGEILKSGSPKDDEFFKEKDKNYFEKIGIKNKKVVLYAPTFRNEYNNNPYDLDFKKVCEYLNKEKDEWVILIKMHPNVKEYKNLFTFDENIIDVAGYSTEELVKNSDIVISDYSSVIFDAMIAGVPGIIYASDMDNYIKERGFYFDLNKLPFPLTTNTEEFIKSLNSNNFKNYKNEYKEYIKSDIGLYSNGKSSKMIVDYIEKNVLK